MTRCLICALATAATVRCAAAAPDYAAKTVVVYNENAPDSQRLAIIYAKARKIPAGNVVALKASALETISRAEFSETIEEPLRALFTERGWWQVADVPGKGRAAVENSMRVITLISGVPLKITDSPSPAGAAGPAAGQQSQASVDSELTLLGLWEKKPGGGINNPYFSQDTPFVETSLPLMLLAGRIDAPTPKICERMIADALAAEAAGLWGRVFLDLAQKGPGYEEGDRWILGAGKVLGTAGWPVIIDAHPQTLPTNYPMTGAAVYFGWWIRNADGPLLNPAFRFQQGAVAYHMHSFAAETLRSDTLNWCGPILAKGAAAALGTVWEPYLAFCTREDIFTDRLIKGYTLAEATWMATPALSWMNVVIGDPLYRPFANVNNASPRPETADYHFYRAALRRYGDDRDKQPLIHELESAAEKRHSGILFEALGLLSQTYFPDDMKRAAQYFEKAGKTYPRVPDRIRAYLQVPDMERRNGKLDGAISDLKRIISEFPKEPETEAARVWLNTLQPPPPPPPPPPLPPGNKKQ